MKNLIIGTALFAGLLVSTTACGGGQKGDVNQDTVISRELTDSMSRSLGAFMGVNLQDQIFTGADVDEFIEGYQMMTAAPLTREKLLGIRAGIYAAEQFMNMSQQGVEVNRDLYLQEFRKYLQKQDLTPEEHKALYDQFQSLINNIENILMKRDQMRMEALAPQTIETPQPEPQAIETETVTEEVIETPAETEVSVNEEITEQAI